MVIFRNQRDGKRVVRKGELIAWRAEFNWTAEEALELRQPRVARQSKGHLSRLKLSARHFAQSLDRGGNYKFGVLPGEVSWKANKCGLDDHIFERPVYRQTLSFIANAAITSGERQRVADMFGGGRDIEQQSSFAWVCLLSEVQPEFIISERLRRVLKQFALSQRGDASLTVVDVVFRDAGSREQRACGDVMLPKDGDRLSSGEPSRAR